MTTGRGAAGSTARGSPSLVVVPLRGVCCKFRSRPMVTRDGLEAWLKGAIVLTCYANSTSPTQIIPSLISRLANVGGPANDRTWVRIAKCTKTPQGAPVTNHSGRGVCIPRVRSSDKICWGPIWWCTLYAAWWCFPPRARINTRQLLRAWTDNCHEKVNWERAW